MFDVAEKMILTPSGLDENRLSTVLDAVMSRGVDYADLIFNCRGKNPGRWKTASEETHSIEQGVVCAPSEREDRLRLYRRSLLPR